MPPKKGTGSGGNKGGKPKAKATNSKAAGKSKGGFSLWTPVFVLLLGIGGFVAYNRLRPKVDPGSPFPTEHLPLKYETIFGAKMAYVEEGTQKEGDPTLVFLHGNPASSYLWRNVIRRASSEYRCVAPDLIGFGASDKLPGDSDDRYSFANHRRHLDELLNKLVPGSGKDVVLVVHDWGSPLGFDWARRNENRIKGIVYFEAIVTTFSFKDYPLATQLFFKALRAPYIGEFLILYLNFFVEFAIPRQIIRPVSFAEMDAYRRPFATAGASRLPTLVFPREVPFDGEPALTHKVISEYSSWLTKSTSIPKLLFICEPGAVLLHERLEYARKFPNQKEIRIEGRHFVQEDHPYEMADHITSWLKSA